ncbi:MAG: group III truncated hemoglobin [Hyphomicrobiaceae bacterium]|nr:group III truncated hemoglobin [Hyphomicrobiaceae bacterium]
MERVRRTAEQRRRDIQANAACLGIDDAYVSLLVDTFYARVRSHDVLGPLFNDVIGDEWGSHLSKMKDFWASVAFNAGRYSGTPVPKHQALTNVREEDFDIWLRLFRETLEDTAPTPEVVPYFMKRAERIATSLKYAMFGLKDLLRHKRAG